MAYDPRYLCFRLKKTLMPPLWGWAIAAVIRIPRLAPVGYRISPASRA